MKSVKEEALCAIEDYLCMDRGTLPGLLEDNPAAKTMTALVLYAHGLTRETVSRGAGYQFRDGQDKALRRVSHPGPKNHPRWKRARLAYRVAVAVLEMITTDPGYEGIAVMVRDPALSSLADTTFSSMYSPMGLFGSTYRMPPRSATGRPSKNASAA